jgi:lysophospholipase L1-like esterase
MTKTFNPRLLKTVLFISILFNLLGAFFLGKRILIKAFATQYIPPPKPPYYLDRNKLFEVMPADSNGIVFLGTSLTQYYELGEFFPGIPVKNRGVHGEMMDKVLLRLSPIIRSKPKKIFIEMGGNDIEQQIPQDSILDMYSQMLDTLKFSCPATKIYVQSLFPVADTSSYAPTYCSPQANKEIKAMNEQLRLLAQRKGCTYIDFHDAFALSGQLNPVYSVDGVHLSGPAYVLWTKILKPYVEE